MKQKRMAFAVTVLCIGLALGLSACGGGSDSSSSRSGGDSGASGDDGSAGGTLKAASTSFPDYLDPQLAYTVQGFTSMWSTYIPLLTLNHAEGAEGSEVIPGLAESLPEVTNGGKTYTLTLRDGLKYSDGSPVKASDFKWAIERCFLLSSGGAPFYESIVGAKEFAETKKGGIPGIKTNDATGEIVINLTAPSGTFTNELALIFAAPVPQATPAEDQTTNPPPSTGAFVITESKAGRSWTLERNPQWEQTNAALMPDLPGAQVDAIEVDVIRNESSQVDDVESGAVNWLFNPPPADRYADVKAQFEGTQFKVEPSLSTYYFWMNNKKAPFDDVKVRQAINYAVNPEALARIYTGQLAETQQILPPGMPGYEQLKRYPYDIEKAKELLAEANPSDKDITVWTLAESPNDEAGEYYQGVLEELGFNATLKVVNPDNYFTIIGNGSTPDRDTGFSGWIEDYPHPSNFLQWVSGESIQPTNNFNFSEASIPPLDKELAKLNEETLGPDQESGYAALDRGYMEEAVWAPFGNRSFALFVSSDIDLDNIIWNPTFQTDLTSLEFK